jgi:hypothetical protein
MRESEFEMHIAHGLTTSQEPPLLLALMPLHSLQNQLACKEGEQRRVESSAKVDVAIGDHGAAM